MKMLRSDMFLKYSLFVAGASAAFVVVVIGACIDGVHIGIHFLLYSSLCLAMC